MRSKCSVDGCGRDVTARGLCSGHYNRLKKTGEIRPGEPLRSPQPKLCQIAGCGDSARTRGMCDGHYQRWRKTGDPEADKPLELKRRNNGAACEVDGCERPATVVYMCFAHWWRWYKTGDARADVPIRISAPRGTGSIYSGYRLMYDNGKRRPEQRIVMEKMLNRPLLPEETVHHINGDKLDNRPANLELWSSRHPKGQRIEDKLAWCREFIQMYGDDFVQPRLLERRQRRH